METYKNVLQSLEIHPIFGKKADTVTDTIVSITVSIMARLKGLEPLTYWFVASHSIQLSYKRRY